MIHQALVLDLIIESRWINKIKLPLRCTETMQGNPKWEKTLLSRIWLMGGDTGQKSQGLRLADLRGFEEVIFFFFG